MKHFRAGLSIEGLKQEYRKLAKKHHPDLGGDTTTMQEINAEYDAYYECLTKPTGSFNLWDIIRRSNDEARKSREFIIFMMKVNNEQPGQFMAFGERSFWGRTEYVPGENWKDVHEGFAKVSVERSSGPCRHIVTGRNITLEAPSFQVMCEKLGVVDRWSRNAKDYDYYETPYGNFYIDRWRTIYANVEGVLTEIYIGSTDFAKDGAEKESFSKEDFAFLAYQDCTFDEFCHYHDVDTQSQFHNALLMQEVKDFVHENPTVSYLCRKGALKIFTSRKDWSLKYGYFDSTALMKMLPRLSIDDIEDVQDFLDELNKNFDQRVAGKIKKGKLKLVI